MQFKLRFLNLHFWQEIKRFDKFEIREVSNKCFIHSPALDKPKIIVFWLYWQQDFKLGFIEAGLLIKHLLDNTDQTHPSFL